LLEGRRINVEISKMTVAEDAIITEEAVAEEFWQRWKI
jgi:hypothetical protein